MRCAEAEARVGLLMKWSLDASMSSLVLILVLNIIGVLLVGIPADIDGVLNPG
jgi:hypothetical protein